MKNLTVDVAIIGAGAAGLFAAKICGESKKSVVLLDHNKSVGKKIKISGGGRCNFTNIHSQYNDFYSDNKNFCKSALSTFRPEDFINLVKKHQITFFEKKLGQLFCKKSSNEIIAMLLKEIEKENIQLLLGQKDLVVKKNKEFFITENHEVCVHSKSLIIATGGLSMPAIGASDFGYRIAKQFGHNVIDPTPALVPFLIKTYSKLSGISLIAELKVNKFKICEDVLFTHKGLSGPAVLKASLHYNKGDEIFINWLPNENVQNIIDTKKNENEVFKILSPYLPTRFLEYLFLKLNIDKKIRRESLSKKMKNQLIEVIHRTKIIPEGIEGFKKAEVTRGGVDTKEISSKTMESQLIPNLYFIGEVLDVTGQLGGHNFQWAWASAFVSGTHINKSN